MLILGLFLLNFIAHSIASPTTPQTVIKQIIDRAKHPDQKGPQKDLASLIDFQKMSSSILEGHLDKISAPQHEKIRTLLQKMLMKLLYPKSSNPFEDMTIQFTNEDDQGSSIHISSIMKKGAQNSIVEYWLLPEKDSFRVVDIAIKGERWTDSIRNQLDQYIHAHNTEALIARMEKRLQELDTVGGHKAPSRVQ